MKNINSLVKMMISASKFYQIDNNEDGTTSVINPFMILVTNQIITEDNSQSLQHHKFNTQGVIKNIDAQLEEGGYAEKDVPSIKSLRECIKEVDVKSPKYSFGDVVVNAKWLLRTLECLSEDVIIEYYNEKTPIRVYNNDSTMYIMPVYVNSVEHEEGDVW